MFEKIKKKNILNPSLFVIITLVLTVIGIAIRTINIIFFFEYDIGYYESDTLLPIIMNIFLVLTALFLIFGSLFLTSAPKELKGIEKNPLTIVASAVCILTFLSIGINFLLFYMYLPIKVIVLYALLSLISCLYFVSNIFNFAGHYRALFAIPVIINIVSILAISYFNIDVQMNSPQKILLHITCLASMFFFIAEARCIFEDMRKKLYILWICATLFFSGVYSLPSLISFVVDGVSDYNFISFIIVFFAIFVYTVMRAITLMTTTKKIKPTDTIDLYTPQSQEEENILSDER